MPASFDNDQFLELAKKWPVAGLQYLHKHFYHKLVHISRQRTNNLQASEDIVQEIFSDLWRKFDKLIAQPGFLVVPYLLMLVRNKSITYYNKSTITRSLSGDSIDSLISSLPTAEDQLLSSDSLNQLRVLVNKLPHKDRECVRLKYFEGMSNDAIAYALRISKKTVEKRLTSGIRQLRKYNGFQK
ncbi:MAG: sigma-70 family RNA polymerase sigma factor [Cyclobacteriaceae bacterium]|nr:sigma-70 family RNA polymerase sigma factor [Cyclobacteriaceae bacterium]